MSVSLAKSADLKINTGHWTCCQEQPAFALRYDCGTLVEVCQPCSATVPRKRLVGLPETDYNALIFLGSKKTPLLVTSCVDFDQAREALQLEVEFLRNQGADYCRTMIVKVNY